jgi:hypothetical protein
VALFFTDMIEDVHFINPVFHNKRQYSRDQYDFICFEKNKAVMFNPLIDLSGSTIRRIELIIGERKLDSINEANFTKNHPELANQQYKKKSFNGTGILIELIIIGIMLLII